MFWLTSAGCAVCKDLEYSWQVASMAALNDIHLGWVVNAGHVDHFKFSPYPRVV